MSDERRATLHIIDDQLGFDETVQVDALALLFDPGGGLKKREADWSSLRYQMDHTCIKRSGIPCSGTSLRSETVDHRSLRDLKVRDPGVTA
jgi:hypothetical protein